MKTDEKLDGELYIKSLMLILFKKLFINTKIEKWQTLSYFSGPELEVAGDYGPRLLKKKKEANPVLKNAF